VITFIGCHQGAVTLAQKALSLHQIPYLVICVCGTFILGMKRMITCFVFVL
jgi:hypothetical protein